MRSLHRSGDNRMPPEMSHSFPNEFPPPGPPGPGFHGGPGPGHPGHRGGPPMDHRNGPPPHMNGPPHGGYPPHGHQMGHPQGPPRGQHQGEFHNPQDFTIALLMFRKQSKKI